VRPWAVYYPEELTTFEKLVLVLEDRRFFRHGGVDPIAVLRETLKLLTLRKHGGASTIDMQFVRSTTDYKERTLRRKLYEMLLACLIQFRYSKITILRSYLGFAYFGWNLRGADRASRAILGKNTSELDLKEAAFMASMLVFPYPKIQTADWTRKISRRANYIEAVYIRRKKRFDEIARGEIVKRT
jgi:membrane peptidoglycan carboxypeptidase